MLRPPSSRTHCSRSEAAGFWRRDWRWLQSTRFELGLTCTRTEWCSSRPRGSGQQTSLALTFHADASIDIQRNKINGIVVMHRGHESLCVVSERRRQCSNRSGLTRSSSWVHSDLVMVNPKCLRVRKRTCTRSIFGAQCMLSNLWSPCLAHQGFLIEQYHGQKILWVFRAI